MITYLIAGTYFILHLSDALDTLRGDTLRDLGANISFPIFPVFLTQRPVLGLHI